MKHYGHAEFQLSSSAILANENNFPSSPSVGQFVFIDKRVWVCVYIAGSQPTWIPITNEIDTYIHNQTSASTTWTVTHNLNTTIPLVQVYGTDNKVFTPDEITIVNNNQVTITVGTAVAGRAVVMYGDISGAPKQTYAYEHIQSSLAITWVVNHNLGYNPIVRVFVGGTEIQPLTVVHNSIMQTTITFTEAKTGYARLV